MTFNQINYFLTVAKNLNFSRAASELFVTQSTLSRSIASLEEELGFKLLERDYHNVKLTPPGELIYQEMPQLMDNIKDLFDRAKKTEEKDTGRLIIGILDGQTVDSAVLAAFRNLSDRFPQFKVELKRTFFHELLYEIKHNTIDVALVITHEDTRLDPGLAMLSIGSIHYYLVASQSHPVWKKEIRLQSLDHEVLIIPADSNPNTAMQQICLEREGVFPEVKKAEDTETNSLWLEAGMGVSIVNEAHIIYRAKAYRPLRVEQLKEMPDASVSLIWNNNHVTQMMDLFFGFLKNNIHETIE